MKLFMIAAFLSFAASTYGNHVHLKPEYCLGETFNTGLGIRLHTPYAEIQGVNISVPYSSQDQCAQSSALLNGKYVGHPTRCVYAAGTGSFGAEYDVNDKTCSVDHSWLFEKIGNVIGKDLRCVPSSNPDGCTPPATDFFYYTEDITWKDYLNGVCVARDICYTVPASFGISKHLCDVMTNDLRTSRCNEVNDARCVNLATSDEDYSQSKYDNAQLENTPCSLTVKQRVSSLYQGSQMNVGDMKWSPNGRYQLILQSDGNLVIYRKPSNRAIWSSKTQGRGVIEAVMQYDGNFVLYAANKIARWHTGTDIKPTNHLLLQDDGNLVIYSMGAPIKMWASKVSGGYLIPMSTNLRTESLNSTSIEDIGTMMTQEDLSDTPVDIVHFDRDPNSASAGTGAVAVDAPDHASNLAVNGFLEE
jgi:hypothetical protein